MITQYPVKTIDLAVLRKNVQTIRDGYDGSGDLNVRELHLHGHEMVCLTLENMINKQIKKYNKIVIARHIGADPDALGSQFALKELIKDFL